MIAFGRFDPELNPPPFSEWSNAFKGVEIDLFQYFNWKPKVNSYFKSWVARKGLFVIPRFSIRTQRTREDYDEAITIWNDAFPGETAYFLIQSGRKAWSFEHERELLKLPASEQFCFEWGKEDTIKSVSFIDSLESRKGWVIDPEWHRSSIPGLKHATIHFKLHGWSDERWVRRYGVSQVSRIVRTVRPREESILTLAYSGKIAEAPLFKL